MTTPDNRPARYVPSGLFMSRVVNPITVWLGGPTLTVRGRRTGRPIRAVVPMFPFEGARYLVSGGGETHWVRNLRAAGQGELRRGRLHERFRAVEVQGDEHVKSLAPIEPAWVAELAPSLPLCRTSPIIRSFGSNRLVDPIHTEAPSIARLKP